MLTSFCLIYLHDPFLEGQSGCLLPPSPKGRERSPLPVLVPAAYKAADQEVSISASRHLTELHCPRGTRFATCTLCTVPILVSQVGEGRRKGVAVLRTVLSGEHTAVGPATVTTPHPSSHPGHASPVSSKLSGFLVEPLIEPVRALATSPVQAVGRVSSVASKPST